MKPSTVYLEPSDRSKARPSAHSGVAEVLHASIWQVPLERTTPVALAGQGGYVHGEQARAVVGPSHVQLAAQHWHSQQEEYWYCRAGQVSVCHSAGPGATFVGGSGRLPEPRGC